MTTLLDVYKRQDLPLADLDVILMRKDPPFDTEFIYATYILERAEDKGTLIVNKPQSLRDCNEKLFTAWFSDLTPETLVTRNKAQLKAFWEKMCIRDRFSSHASPIAQMMLLAYSLRP